MPPERAPATKPFKPQRPSNSNSNNASSSRAQTSSRPTQSQSQSQSEVERERDAPAEEAPAIPPELLTTLLHEFFTDERTRISRAANEAVGKYMEIFVREAIARAANERRIAGGAGGGVGDFLEVEDLEKLAPQLVLDF